MADWSSKPLPRVEASRYDWDGHHEPFELFEHHTGRMLYIRADTPLSREDIHWVHRELGAWLQAAPKRRIPHRKPRYK